MNKTFIIIIVIIIATQLSACTMSPVPATQATLGATPGVITTTNVTSISTPAQTTSLVPTLTVNEVKREMDSGSNFVLVDVRPRADYDMGHLVGAVSIPIQELSNRYAEISQEAEVIVYGACTWGDDAGTRAVQILLGKGLQNVIEMNQGFAAWQTAAYPVEVSP